MDTFKKTTQAPKIKAIHSIEKHNKGETRLEKKYGFSLYERIMVYIGFRSK